MDITIQQTKKVLTGNYSISHLSLSILLTRLKSKYSKDPTDETLQNCTDEINSFFRKNKSSTEKEWTILSEL